MMIFAFKMMNWAFKMMNRPPIVQPGWVKRCSWQGWTTRTDRLSNATKQRIEIGRAPAPARSKTGLLTDNRPENEEFCVRNHEFCVGNYECCVRNEAFCHRNDGFCAKECWTLYLKCISDRRSSSWQLESFFSSGISWLIVVFVAGRPKIIIVQPKIIMFQSKNLHCLSSESSFSIIRILIFFIKTHRYRI